MSPEIPDTVSAAGTTPEMRLLSTLRTIDFPATKDDLLRIAVLDHLEVSTIDALRDLPTRHYHGVTEVLRSLAPQAWSGEYAKIA